MDTERAEGIVLRTQPVTESSLLVTWYTREWGKLRTLAKGARRPKSPLRGKLDLFYRDELLVVWSRRGDLHLVHECSLEQAYVGLRRSVWQLSAATYLCELVDLATAVEDANPVVYELLTLCLAALEQRGDPMVVMWFEMRLLATAGWGPNWQAQAGIAKVLDSLRTASLVAAQRVRLSEGQAVAARQLLDSVWSAAIGRGPRSRPFVARNSSVDKPM